MAKNGNSTHMRQILFFLFFVSGFCGLLYQVVWTRLAFAAFGIITPVLSVVLSVFMLGLSLGSVFGGRWIPALTRRTGYSGAFFYGLAELIIGVGAFAVPKLFEAGQRVLLGAGETDSFNYLFLSALVLALSLFPWCFFMGTTFPFMMAWVRENEAQETKSFSFLYTANVLGAMCGTVLTALVLIELFGFHHTLQVAAAGNFCIALMSALLGWTQSKTTPAPQDETAITETNERPAIVSRTPFIRWILFSTGFCAMAMEVVWTRAFTPVLKTQVYSFALIVFAYLGATFAGSWWYRRHLKRTQPWPAARLMGFLMIAVFLPIVFEDTRFVKTGWEEGNMDPLSAALILASICPFCAILGYLTPSLVDEYAEGDPKRAGGAYAINVAGCIIGPLFASYVLLPQMSEQWAMTLLGAPFLMFYFAGGKPLPAAHRWATVSGAGAIAVYALLFTHNFLYQVKSASKSFEVRRDYAATVIAVDDTNGTKHLLVNGVGMTTLMSSIKYLASLPLALHEGKPESALVICFGMGTTYRSALSWGINVTAVELIPDVPKTFGFYYPDAPEVLSNPKGHIVIDDGRRFLERTREKYDVIIIDPPPPVEAAGSSLLYSTDMYELLKQHLKPHGIAQVWFPGGSDVLLGEAVFRSATASFPYVHVFVSINGWGVHIVCSMDPIKAKSMQEMLAQMPDNAKKDLLEWSKSKDVRVDLGTVLSQEVDLSQFLNADPQIQVTDDEPMNEYYLLRRLVGYITAHSQGRR